MRLLPVKKTTRVDARDAMGHGMDAVIMLVLFLGAGYGLDQVFGTTPLFRIAMTVLGSVGSFLKFKYRYNDRMDELEAQRLGKHAARSADSKLTS